MKRLIALIGIAIAMAACSKNELAANASGEPTAPAAAKTRSSADQRPSADERMRMDMAFERFQVALAEASASPPAAQQEELEKMRKIRDLVAALSLQDGCLANVNKIRGVAMNKAIDSLRNYLDGNEAGGDEAMREAGKTIVQADDALAKCPS